MKMRKCKGLKPYFAETSQTLSLLHVNWLQRFSCSTEKKIKMSMTNDKMSFKYITHRIIKLLFSKHAKFIVGLMGKLLHLTGSIHLNCKVIKVEKKNQSSDFSKNNPFILKSRLNQHFSKMQKSIYLTIKESRKERNGYLEKH
ncbi:CLUMA_CG020217, isoform A [Clunio marinus]|uniref:CLUMA_CG020217, isoform A n=1 Tax=Clunio marinus TaxID=568069 RepID=A0A1J1J4A3_9DIPT|nr:CLUMA_CG020217, isoform A [Clunio marinus]